MSRRADCAGRALQSDTHVVLATLKRAPSELSSFARKIFKIDDHLGIAASGLASDGRVLCRYMRNECINHRQALHCLPACQRPAALFLAPSSIYLGVECIPASRILSPASPTDACSQQFARHVQAGLVSPDWSVLHDAGSCLSRQWRWAVSCGRLRTRAR